MTEQNSISVERVIDAAPKAIFDILSNPERHHEADASGMVGTDQKSDRLEKTGDTFVMNMTMSRGNQDLEYQTRNEVTGFVDGKLIAWRPGQVDADQPFGWEWLYELEPQGADATNVRLTYDWRNAPADVVSKYHLPKFDAAALEASLGKLAEAVSN